CRLEALQAVLLHRDFASQRVVLGSQDLDGRPAAAGGGTGGWSVVVTGAVAILQAAAQRNPGLEAAAVLLVVALREVAGGPGLPTKLIGRLAVDALRCRAGRARRWGRSRQR